MIIIYEIPAVFVIFAVVCGLGLLMESIQAFPMIATVIVGISEMIFVGMTIYRHAKSKSTNDSKSEWTLAYVLTILKSAVLTLATYFFFLVPAEKIANSRGQVDGILTVFGSIIYTLIAGIVFCVCIGMMWLRSMDCYERAEHQENKSSFYLQNASVSLAMSFGILILSIIILPRIFGIK